MAPHTPPDSLQQYPVNALPEEWYRDKFNHFSPDLANHLVPTLEQMRSRCPVTHSSEFDGFWIATRYKDIQRIAQDWKVFSSERGVIVPHMGDRTSIDIPAIPEMVDPPRHGFFKDLLKPHLTPEAVAANTEATRRLIHEFIDRFIDRGQCEFMEELADPLPGRILFDLYFNAPTEELAELTRLASLATVPLSEAGFDARLQILDWIRKFVELRRQQPRKDDLIDALIHAEVDGSPITEAELLGMIQLLVFGGLDTTAGTLGNIMVRFCRQPEIPQLLREQPELIPAAVEELLRLDAPFVFIARTLTEDVEVAGQQLKAGEQVMVSWRSANYDEEVFVDPKAFDLQRENCKRHMAFGSGTHRCAGQNLARLNLELTLEALVNRLGDIRFAEDAEPITYHPGFSQAPKQVPIRFTPRK